MTEKRKRPRGRPSKGLGQSMGLRLYPWLEKAIDQWIKRQDDAPGRHEAVRRLIERGLRASS